MKACKSGKLVEKQICVEQLYFEFITIDGCCFYYFLRNSLVALLEALFARN
jgi:hypothetical protein